MNFRIGCDHLHPALDRRQMLQIGSIGLMGLSMGDVERHKALAATARKNHGSARSPKKVVYLFLTGGPPQHETFDLKPHGPDTVRGEFRPIATRTPGLEICEHLPLLAQRSHQFAILRSMTHHSNKHLEGSYIMCTGLTDLPPNVNKKHPDSEDAPAITAVGGRFRPGANHLPGAVVVPQFLLRDTGRFVPGQYGGHMGRKFDPWEVHAAAKCRGMGPCPQCFHYQEPEFKHTAYPVFDPPNVRFGHEVTRPRFERRMSLLESLDQSRRKLDDAADEAGIFDRYQEQAASLLTSAVTRQAFDLKGVSDGVLDAYGRNQFGWSLLLTRRLLEAGVSMIQVNMGRNGTWDLHSRAFSILKNHLLPQTDRALSAFMDDLDARGLLDDTLIVMAGEFGRSPAYEIPVGATLPGRFHWGRVQSVFFGGGGVTGGTVVGASDKLGGEPADNPKRPQDMAATIYEALGIPQNAQYPDIHDRPHFVYQGKPIHELYG